MIDFLNTDWFSKHWYYKLRIIFCPEIWTVWLEWQLKRDENSMRSNPIDSIWNTIQPILFAFWAHLHLNGRKDFIQRVKTKPIWQCVLEFGNFDLRWRAHTQHPQEGNWANEERWARQIKRQNEERKREREWERVHRSEELGGSVYVRFAFVYV